MIPIDQVSALIQVVVSSMPHTRTNSTQPLVSTLQKLTAEQEGRLAQQRGEIVREVLRSLRDSELEPRGAPKKQASTKLEVRAPIDQTRRLDESLHGLMLHSLSESGLDFPHVQNSHPGHHFDYTRERNRSGSASRTAVAPLQLDGRASLADTRRDVILCRVENSDTDESFGPSERGMKTPKGERSGAEAAPERPRRCTQSQCNARFKYNHPLGKTVRSRRRRSTNAELDDGAVDESFRAARSKIDHRTLAIIDKTKALLEQNPVKGEARVSIAELRDRRRFANSQVDSSPDKIKIPPFLSGGGSDHTTPDRNPGNDTNLRDGNDLTTSPQEEVVAGSPRSPQSISTSRERLDEDSQGRQQSTRKREVLEKISPEICDIDLLRAPDRPPDDENEWENELARQILTIYATSVKAKAAAADATAVRPYSGATRGKARSATAGTAFTSCVSKSPERLGCSLPALSPQSGVKMGTDVTRLLKPAIRQKASVNYSWEPSQRREDGRVVVNMPNIPKPIWFAGTGAVKAVWCALTESYGELTATRSTTNAASPPSALPRAPTLCSHRLCEEVRRMEAQHQFLECVTALEALLIALVRARGASELEVKLWKQLVVMCNAFASRCIDYKKFSAALKLAKQAEQLVDNSVLVSDAMRLELLAYLYDTYAHYYYRRRKPHAALQYCAKAHEIHARQSSWSHVAKSRLHMATALSVQKRHTEALEHMGGVLALVEANRLEDGASGQKLCLVAVCYNNLAVEQLHLRELEAAGVAAENAQRLAKLCLSYSNRWLAQFDATRQCVALALATLMEPVSKKT